jgi:hypothetical protein
VSSDNLPLAPISLDTESLFDILYVDSRRVATYLAQLDPNGSLTGIKVSASGTATMAGDARASFVAASGGVHLSDVTSEANERQFDPQWVLPITLMNRLDELGFINRGLANAGIGSLVLAEGFCRMVDIATVKEMWPAIAKILAMQAAVSAQSGKHQFKEPTRNERRDRRREEESPSLPLGLEILADVAKNMPHSLELHFMTEQGIAWATLQRECLLINAQDVALKHGSVIPGNWHVLGVVDARPNEEAPEVWKIAPIGDFTGGIIGLVDELRSLMGRPLGYYGLTPLIIFRSIKKVAAG